MPVLLVIDANEYATILVDRTRPGFSKIALLAGRSLSSKHSQEAQRDEASRRPPAHQQPGPVDLRRMADCSMEEGAERAQALEAHLEADLGDAQFAGGQQRLGSLETPL